MGFFNKIENKIHKATDRSVGSLINDPLDIKGFSSGDRPLNIKNLSDPMKVGLAAPSKTLNVAGGIAALIASMGAAGAFGGGAAAGEGGAAAGEGAAGAGAAEAGGGFTADVAPDITAGFDAGGAADAGFTAATAPDITAGFGGGSSFIPAVDSVAPLSSEFASSLGITPSVGDLGVGTSLDTAGGFTADVAPDPTAGYIGGLGVESGGFMDSLPSYLKHAPSIISALNAVRGITAKPKIPGQLKQAGDTASQQLSDSQAIINSGGTSSPNWQQQKSGIDSSIDAQIRDSTSKLMQQAVNSGMGADSQVTQQQLQQMKENLEGQRQSLYLQAQSQNVSQAIQVMTNADRVLQSIGNAELQQNQEIRQSVFQSAMLAGQLYARGL